MSNLVEVVGRHAVGPQAAPFNTIINVLYGIPEAIDGVLSYNADGSFTNSGTQTILVDISWQVGFNSGQDGGVATWLLLPQQAAGANRYGAIATGATSDPWYETILSSNTKVVLKPGDIFIIQALCKDAKTISGELNNGPQHDPVGGVEGIWDVGYSTRINYSVWELASADQNKTLTSGHFQQQTI